jgi:hypothetical protein
MKFILFVEGYTEAEDKRLGAYLKRWLDPQLRERVGIAAIRFDGWADFLKDVPTRARLHFESPNSGEIIGIIGLLDLYGPTIYPAQLLTSAQRFEWLKAHIEKRVGHVKYRQFFAVPDIEAWLLSQPELFPRAVQEAFPRSVERPESISLNEPAAYLLQRLYKKHVHRTYKKRVDGPNLFDKADPNEGYKKCPYLKSLLDEMLKMAKQAGL